MGEPIEAPDGGAGQLHAPDRAPLEIDHAHRGADQVRHEQLVPVGRGDDAARVGVDVDAKLLGQRGGLERQHLAALRGADQRHVERLAVCGERQPERLAAHVSAQRHLRRAGRHHHHLAGVAHADERAPVGADHHLLGRGADRDHAQHVRAGRVGDRQGAVVGVRDEHLAAPRIDRDARAGQPRAKRLRAPLERLVDLRCARQLGLFGPRELGPIERRRVVAHRQRLARVTGSRRAQHQGNDQRTTHALLRPST